MARDLTFDRAIAFAADLIRIPGPPGAEGEVAARVREELLALRYDEVWTDRVGNVFGRVKGSSDGPCVMLSCHLDVVDVGDPELWEHDPYGGLIEGGFLHGRGAMDIKGPLAIQTYAAATFLAEPPPGDIVVAHTVLEERGGLGMSHLLEAGEVRADGVIIGEATAGDICIGHRGRAEIHLDIHGLAGHASAPERAHSALDPLAAIIPALRDFADTLPSDAVLGPATCAATDVQAAPPSHNVIPDFVRLTLDARLLPDWSHKRIVDALDEFLRDRLDVSGVYRIELQPASEQQHCYTGYSRERPLATPGFLLPEDHPVAQAAVDAVAATTGRRPALRPWTFATDGGHSCGVHGIPTIGFAPGEERYAHTNQERLELEAARVIYEAYPSVIRAVQESLRMGGARPGPA